MLKKNDHLQNSNGSVYQPQNLTNHTQTPKQLHESFQIRSLISNPSSHCIPRPTLPGIVQEVYLEVK